MHAYIRSRKIINVHKPLLIYVFIKFSNVFFCLMVSVGVIWAQWISDTPWHLLTTTKFPHVFFRIFMKKCTVFLSNNILW